jgi:hypothetical protein
LETPAGVHIVAGDPKTFIEATNFEQRRLPIGHVAAWNVLCLAISQHHVDGAARRICDAIGDPAIATRRKVRTAYAYKVSVKKCSCEVFQPIWIRIGVIVNVGEDFASCLEEPDIASVAEA